ncbi:hypothetical protein AAF712_007846 [Marasmius tenuissimus]|uniref:RING-type domain-containing protein n=1 Tax=Marasmius tenuissimus TaxID=585030 RepID=A0ABR2ZVR2_9AGAR|nr:hypothetical protein PM082_011096 [Marasmius tenuissimus]
MAPRTSKQSSSESRSNARRSSRINNRQSGPSGSRSSKKRELANGEIPQAKRRKVQQKASASDPSTLCRPDTPASETIGPRRSQRITPSELIKREQALLKREQGYKQTIQSLQTQNSTLTTKVEETTQQLTRMRESEAEAALAQLEEHFTCPLCYEIMAHPYSLNPGQCGHTFCALCILKWFFSRLHRQCGGWHESVDCPICRSLLVITPDRTPRLDVTFPFVPNRIAATICESLIEKLGQAPAGCAFMVKREDSEGIWGSDMNMECSRKRGESKKEEDANEASNLSHWCQGGSLRSEWVKKDRDGKKEMNHLLKHWTEMQATDFVSLKSKLGV